VIVSHGFTVSLLVLQAMEYVRDLKLQRSGKKVVTEVIEGDRGVSDEVSSACLHTVADQGFVHGLRS